MPTDGRADTESKPAQKEMYTLSAPDSLSKLLAGSPDQYTVVARQDNAPRLQPDNNS